MRRRLLTMLGLLCILGLDRRRGLRRWKQVTRAAVTTAPADTARPADTGGGGRRRAATLGSASRPRCPGVCGVRRAAPERHGVRGRPDQRGRRPVTVEIVSKDNKGDQTQTLTTAQELLDDGINVQVMTTADAGPAVGQLVSQAGGIMSVGSNTAPAIVRDGGERIFAFVFGDNQQASAGAQYACDQGYKAAYLLGSPEIPTRRTCRRSSRTPSPRSGGEIVGEDTFKIGQTEFGPQVTKIQNASPAPDVLFSPIFVPDSALLKRCAGRRRAPLITTDGNDTTLFVDSGGSAVDEPCTRRTASTSPEPRWPSSSTSTPSGRAARPSRTRSRRSAATTSTRTCRRRRTPARPSRTRSSRRCSLKDVPLLTGSMTMDPGPAIRRSRSR